jgi:hypothetical protein
LQPGDFPYHRNTEEGKTRRVRAHCVRRLSTPSRSS